MTSPGSASRMVALTLSPRSQCTFLVRAKVEVGNKRVVAKKSETTERCCVRMFASPLLERPSPEGEGFCDRLKSAKARHRRAMQAHLFADSKAVVVLGLGTLDLYIP